MKYTIETTPLHELEADMAFYRRQIAYYSSPGFVGSCGADDAVSEFSALVREIQSEIDRRKELTNTDQ